MNADLDKWATWREIHAQPAIWRAWADAFDPTKISAWIDGLDIDQIWLSGAGTSAFIGDIIAAGLEALDGPIALTECIDDTESNCGIARLCPARTNWHRINGAIRDALDGITLDEMTGQIPSAFMLPEDRNSGFSRKT